MKPQLLYALKKDGKIIICGEYLEFLESEVDEKTTLTRVRVTEVRKAKRK